MEEAPLYDVAIIKERKALLESALNAYLNIKIEEFEKAFDVDCTVYLEDSKHVYLEGGKPLERLPRIRIRINI